MPPLPACDLHAAIQDSFAVVNSSRSEGMASAVLEVSLVSSQTTRLKNNFRKFKYVLSFLCGF